MSQYTPPFTITTKIIQLLSEICEKIGKLSILLQMDPISIEQADKQKAHDFLAFTFSTTEPESLLHAYQYRNNWSTHAQSDLLNAYSLLLNEQGSYRNIHTPIQKGKMAQMIPQASLVPSLMDDLFYWLESSQDHPLITSAVFHYEFRFIHPFATGNHQMGCFWHTLILEKWHPVFTYLGIESVLCKHQEEYEDAINQSTLHGDSVPFIEFILHVTNNELGPLITAEKENKKHLKTIDKTQKPQEKPHNKAIPKKHITPQVKALIATLEKHQQALSRVELQQALGLKDRKSFRERYLKPALEEGLISMTIPDKPKSKIQQYVLTQ